MANKTPSGFLGMTPELERLKSASDASRKAGSPADVDTFVPPPPPDATVRSVIDGWFTNSASGQYLCSLGEASYKKNYKSIYNCVVENLRRGAVLTTELVERVYVFLRDRNYLFFEKTEMIGGTEATVTVRGAPNFKEQPTIWPAYVSPDQERAAAAQVRSSDEKQLRTLSLEELQKLARKDHHPATAGSPGDGGVR